MKIKLALAAALLAALPLAANAEVVNINFEDLPAPSLVTNQYASLGVQFSTSPTVDLRGGYHDSVEIINYGGLGSFGSRAASLWSSPITLTFDSDVSNFSVLMNDTERGTLLGSVRAYDASGHLIAMVNDMTGAYNTAWFYQNTLRIQAGGIRSIELSADSDGAVFDNISFTRVPAPGTAALLPVALLGLGRRKRL
ncbi:MAG: hypothetical protein JSS51_06650 [Planctomycetes bacterium]|nr:hypothetical protein [Planctomycetota bacterium]